MWMKRSTFLVLLLTLLYSCEAPRDNPMDPQNPNYNYGRISGTIKTISLPVETIPQTIVKWQGGSELTISNEQGEFEFLLSNPKNGWLNFSHPEFHSDSHFVNWPDNRELRVEAFLNALPIMDSLFLYSVVLNRFPSFQKEQMIIEAHISDRDNDIDSVFAIFNDDKKKFHLSYNTTQKNFRQELSILDLGVLSIEELVGEPINIEVCDLFSNVLSVGQGQLKRVIHDEVIVLSPIDNMVTGPFPTLVWQSLQTTYSFHYNLEIYTNEVAPVMVWQRMKISNDQTTHTVDTALTVGSYFWVIWAIDRLW